MWTPFRDDRIRQKTSARDMEVVGRYKRGDESVGTTELREIRC